MTGRVTISVEIELGWGFHDKADPREIPELSDDGQAEREALDWFLKICDEAGVPVTFDIVGHLLLPSCNGNHDGPHPDGWFDRDPGTDADTDPLFYFPDVADKICNAEVDHEIATHTFSHVLCDEITNEVLDWELKRAHKVHEEDVVSLVPPRHRKPSYDVLRRNGIEVVRLAVDDAPPAGAVRNYIWTLTRDHPLDDLSVSDSIVETYSSPFMTLTAPYLSRGVSSPHPAYRVIPRRIRQRLHERFLSSGLGSASSHDVGIHYWTHLYNMANEAQREPIRRFVETLGNSDGIEKMRMVDLAE